MNNHFDSIAIIGLGVIGSSLAVSYHRAYPDAYVMGIDVDPHAIEEAKERGWIDEGFLPEQTPDAISGCGLVVICTPVSAAEHYFKLIAECEFEGVVTDVCSTKALVSKQAEGILPHPEKYIPGHPMAGSEKSGIEGAREDLFQGAHWVLCPNSTTSGEELVRLHEALVGMGARVVTLPRDLHDEAVAIVSHVPHFAAAGLVELAVRHAGDQEALFRLAAGGFKDSTRIAAGSPSLWTGIAFDNREAIVSGLDELTDILKGYADALRDGDRERFTALLKRAADARRALPTKWVPLTENLLSMRIPMPNRPGVVAEITTFVGKAGCNIQTIDIDHITSSSAVLSVVLTDEGDVGKLSTELIKAGYSVSFNPLISGED